MELIWHHCKDGIDEVDMKFCQGNHSSTHWDQVTLICVSKLSILGSDNGLSPGQCQAIIWTNAGILLIEPLGTNYNEILIKIHTFSFKKMHSKMSSGKWRTFCLGLSVLICENVIHYNPIPLQNYYLQNVSAVVPIWFHHFQVESNHHNWSFTTCGAQYFS